MRLSKVRNWLMSVKFYMGRSSSYLSLINISMVFFLFLSTLKDKGYIGFDIASFYIPAIIISLLFFAVIGWIEVKHLKGFSEEIKIVTLADPVHKEMKEKIDYIYTKLKG